jgi:hypothetical protein
MGKVKVSAAKPWRVQSDDAGEFDEIVVGHWLHVERMDTGAFFIAIGDKRGWVTIRAGKVTLTWEDEPARALSKKGARRG